MEAEPVPQAASLGSEDSLFPLIGQSTRHG